jgi:transcriptional regulator with PAS, ATPase and Fis domain
MLPKLKNIRLFFTFSIFTNFLLLLYICNHSENDHENQKKSKNEIVQEKGKLIEVFDTAEEVLKDRKINCTLAAKELNISRNQFFKNMFAQKIDGCPIYSCFLVIDS